VLGNGRWIDKDGYVRVGGLKGKHPRWTTGGVYEHILVAEEKLGRPLKDGERVHHRNEIKHDNRPDNLQVMENDSAHAGHHGRDGGFRRLNGGRTAKGGVVQFVPHFDTVVTVEPDGEAEVFDVVCADPHRNFVANGVVVHNCGKTLAAQEVIEKSGASPWYWVGPKSSLANIQREFDKWEFDKTVEVEFLTYDKMQRVVDEWPEKAKPPCGVIFDESSRLKHFATLRTKAAQKLADLIREHYDKDGYVILMSGTPAPKRPTDWWSQCEIAYPGFLREGSEKALTARLAILNEREIPGGQKIHVPLGWKDDERKCDKCGHLKDEPIHTYKPFNDDYHKFKPCKNEIALLYERLKGLVVIKHKKDCLTLPEKQYRAISCPPSGSLMRVAKTLLDTAPNTITGLTLSVAVEDRAIFAAWPRPPRAEWRAGDGASGG
jgi:hypothetical protein